MGINKEDIEKLYEEKKVEAESSGYKLNPDVDFTLGLMEGLLINEKRYGYQSCPCRLASGKIEEDQDIICPCDYRDADVAQYGSCYCGLYVSQEIANGDAQIQPIPERRGENEEHKGVDSSFSSSLSLPVWRCKVCGYLCARQQPPEACPICKAKKEKFERFM
ncbi:MAG: hypothetical protein PWP48_380 [Clostridiales bacterium]|jgi:ferredoxin-thioredoxin reductase catalytic subunit|nr:hypothetical protein [Clostridiales bacterium]